jgi:hypothetical protein
MRSIKKGEKMTDHQSFETEDVTTCIKCYYSAKEDVFKYCKDIWECPNCGRCYEHYDESFFDGDRGINERRIGYRIIERPAKLTKRIGKICNMAGVLEVQKKYDRYYWYLTEDINIKGNTDVQEIPQYLYDALIKFEKEGIK